MYVSFSLAISKVKGKTKPSLVCLLALDASGAEALDSSLILSR